jgi:hypothetical protein
MSLEVMQVVLMDRVRAYGPMLHVCPVAGCSTITMGGTCVEHDPPVEMVFPRGRPYVPPATHAELRVHGEPLRDAPG